jgi:hypothetical protein
MFATELKCVINKCPLGSSATILRGPPSFGFFNSMKAGKNVMRIRAGVTTNMIIAVRFGIIYGLLSIIAYFPI